jgi:hypothetical protein
MRILVWSIDDDEQKEEMYGIDEQWRVKEPLQGGQRFLFFHRSQQLHNSQCC